MDQRPDPKSVSLDLDSAVNLEATHYEEGYGEGYAAGTDSGRDEARQVGLKVGFETGEELGFYEGCVGVWKSAIRVDPGRFSTRVRKSVGTMELLLAKFPLSDPENDGVQEILGDLRLKFKAVCASLGVKFEYKGYPKSADAEAFGF